MRRLLAPPPQNFGQSSDPQSQNQLGAVPRPDQPRMLGQQGQQNSKPSPGAWSVVKDSLTKFGDTSGKVLGAVSGAAGWLANTAFGDIAKTAVQLPQTTIGSAMRLPEEVRSYVTQTPEQTNTATGKLAHAGEQVMKPKNVPVLGKVQALSAVPGDISKLGAQTAEETAGQAVGMAGEAAAFAGGSTIAAPLESGAEVPLGLKVAGGVETGVTMGAAGGASQALKSDKSAMDVAKSTATGAAVGGLAGGATVLASEGVQALAGKISRGAVTRMIKPIASSFKFGKDPVGAFIDEGFTGNTIEDIADQVTTRKNEVGAGIDQAIQQAEQANPDLTVDATDILGSIDNQIKKSAYSPDDLAELQRIRGMITETRDVVGGESVVTGQRDVESLSPSEAQQIKRIIGDNTSWTGKASDAVNSFTKKLYGMFDGKIDDAVPEAADLNDRYGDLLSLNKATQRAVEQKMAKAGRGDLTDIGAGVTAVGALFSGNLKLAGGIVATDVARHLADSPAVASRLASLMSTASDADIAAIASKYPNFANALNTLGKDGLMKLAQVVSQPK